jgi:hypothetical protein
MGPPILRRRHSIASQPRRKRLGGNIWLHFYRQHNRGGSRCRHMQETPAQPETKDHTMNKLIATVIAATLTIGTAYAQTPAAPATPAASATAASATPAASTPAPAKKAKKSKVKKAAPAAKAADTAQAPATPAK